MEAIALNGNEIDLEITIRYIFCSDSIVPGINGFNKVIKYESSWRNASVELISKTCSGAVSRFCRGHWLGPTP